MNNKTWSLKDNIVYGGLYDLNEENIEIRKLHLLSNNYLHTANDYNNSLEVISRASAESKLKPKIFSKVFYNYPNLRSKRYKSIYLQMDEILSRLKIIPEDWILQISSYCNPTNLLSKNAEIFFERIKNEFGISRVLFEYYPVYSYNFQGLLAAKNYYRDLIDIGIIGYQNKFSGVFDENLILNLSENNFTVSFIGFLGLSKRLLLKNIFYKFNKIDYLNQNIIYSLESNEHFKNLFLITKTSSSKNFLDLQQRIKKAENNSLVDIKKYNKIKQIIDYKYNDPYFSKYYLFLYFFNFKLIYIQLINIILILFYKKIIKNLWMD